MPDADDAGQDQPVLLVVEDDFLVRLTLVDGLSDAGFRVLEAGDALAALGLLATRREILAMLTDINLPGVADGYALAHAARVLRPDLPVVYASGRYGAMAEQRAVPGARFLAKPFAASLAAQVLREVLGHAGRGGPFGPPGSPGAAGTLPPP